jgi:hypothetical protein
MTGIGSFRQEERTMLEKVLEEKRAQYSQAMDNALGNILEQLANMPEVHKVILVDHPFRGSDRIEIPELGTWGDIVEIDTLTARIRTRDNRLVIVPNSIVGKSQVVNHTYPDPTHRIQMDMDTENVHGTSKAFREDSSASTSGSQ